MGKLDGKVAIISGSAQGVGKGVAEAMAGHGAKVVILDINEEGAEKTAAEIVAKGGEAIGLGCDISQRDQIQQVVDKTVETFGTVDIMVNNAHASKQKPFETLTEDDFALSFNTGFWGTYYFMQAVFPIFKEKKAGKIINFGSNSSILGHAYQGAYAAAKTISRIPLRRVGDCKDDIGEVAAWLASHEADYVTGQTILVDGGAHYVR